MTAQGSVNTKASGEQHDVFSQSEKQSFRNGLCPSIILSVRAKGSEFGGIEDMRLKYAKWQKLAKPSAQGLAD